MEKERIHNPSNEERKEYSTEMQILDAYRTVLKEDVRAVVHEELQKFYNSLDLVPLQVWMGRISISGKQIYLSPIAILLIIAYLIQNGI